MTKIYTLILYLLVTVGLAGYVLPWIVAPSAALTLNAYDLAEWTSLHPLQRQTSPPLLAPLELRLQLVIFTVTLGMLASGRSLRAISGILIVLLAFAQLPPFEFLNDIRNLNYGQQFALALASLILSLAALPFNPPRILPIVLAVLSALGIASALHGLSQAQELFAHLQQNASTAAGFWITVASYGGIIVVSVASSISAQQSQL